MTKYYYDKLLNHPILKVGVDKASSLNEEKKVYLVNVIGILILISFSLVMVIGILFDPRLISKSSLIGHLFPTLLIGVVFYFQHKGLHTLAKVLLILITLTTCYLFDIYILPEAQIRMYSVFLPLISLVIFNRKWISIAYLILCCVLFLDVFHLKNGIDYNQIHFSILFLIIFFLVYSLIEVNNRSELKLEKQQKELEELNKFKSHFFVNLSHEIRTPLTIIKGYTSRLYGNNSEIDNDKKVQVIEEQVIQIQNILDNILTLSKLDVYKLELNIESVDVNSFIDKHYSDYKALFNAKKIDFNLRKNLQDIRIKADANLLSKSFNNLLDNALKFTSENGSVTLNVSHKTDLNISIIDDGIGIPKNDIENVFKRFYQSKNHITKSQGSGIGLSFAKSIIEAHGFNLALTSIPNVQTCFSISIPKLAILLPENGNGNTTPTTCSVYKTAQKSNIHKQKHVLVVEDHEVMRHYLKSVLQAYKVTEAKNGKEAMAILKRNTFDAIITDFMMPTMDGIELVTEIKKMRIATPIIVITARKDNDGKLNMLRLGIDSYLTKPFIEEELKINVKRAISFYDTIKRSQSEIDHKDKIFLNSHGADFNSKLKTYIEANIKNKNFGVENIAFHMNLSRSSLHRKTKLLLGQTPNEIIMEVRLQKAKIILENTPHIKKKTLAEEVGIINASYFYKKLEERFSIKKLE